MSTNQRFRASPPSRDATPSPRRRARAALLFGLALVGLIAPGCGSLQTFRDRLSCNSCSGGMGLGGGLFRNGGPRLGERLFGSNRAPTIIAPGAVGGCSTCGGEGFVGGEVIEGLPAPGAIVVPSTPGAVVVPGKAPTVVPGGNNDVPDLEDLPGASNGPSPAAIRSSPAGRSGTNANAKTNYQTSRGETSPRASRLGGYAQADLASASEATRHSTRRQPATTANHPLDRLPPLPGESAKSGNGSVPPPAEIDPGEILVRAIPVPTPEPAKTPAPPAPARADPLPEIPADPEATDPAAALGIKRFRALDAQVAGGSFPTMEGLNWLRDRGYRTLIDIRDSDEIDQAEVDAIAHLGMKHVRLPLNPKSIDPDLLDRFAAILKDNGARPVYFCDTDGNRAGLMWFLHRQTADPVAPDMAGREASEIGLADARLLLQAADYLHRRGKPAEAAPAQLKPAAPKSILPAPTDVAPEPPAPLDVPGLPTPVASLPPTPEGSASWNMYAAPMAALLCVPLAYYGRTTVNNLGHRIRASLPAPSQPQRSLPGASDE